MRRAVMWSADPCRPWPAHDASRDRGIYDAMHVRRGDFQFTPTRLPAEKLFELSEGGLSKGATLYIATDEKVSAAAGRDWGSSVCLPCPI